MALEERVAAAAGERAVELLQSGNSEWPVRTGRSKAGFSYREENGDAIITNDQDYAVHIEERTGVAYDTLTAEEQAVADSIAEAVVEQITLEIEEAANG